MGLRALMLKTYLCILTKLLGSTFLRNTRCCVRVCLHVRVPACVGVCVISNFEFQQNQL